MDLPAAAFPAPRGKSLHVGAFIVIVAVASVAVPAWLGLLSLPSLAVLALVAGGVAIATLLAAPQLLVVLIPALLPAPIMAYTYAWELLLWVLAALMVLHGWRTRAPWLFRLSTLELWLLAYTAWALISWFWSPDPRTFAIGARRVILGLLTFWMASRLPMIASRRWFDAGLIAAAMSLACAAMLRSMSTGFTDSQALLRRPEVTNLGWGTANFIATLLLLFSPTLIAIATQGRVPLRAMAWVAAALGAAMQMVIASRAASVLFLGGTLYQFLRLSGRHSRWMAALAVGVMAAMLATPPGQALLFRFTSLRELGSMTIRLWYLREGWARMIEHFPLGMGLGQGYSNADKLQGTDPHNFWLVVGGDHGVPGLVLWAIVLVILWRAAARMSGTPEWRGRSQALLIAMSLGHLHTLVEPTFQGTQYPFVFFWLVGGSIAYHLHETKAAANSPR